MSDTIEVTNSSYYSPKTTRYETTLKIIKGRVIRLNCDLVSGHSSFAFSEGSVDNQSGIAPVKLNIKKCFMLRKGNDRSTTETSRTPEFINTETTENGLSKVDKNDTLVSMSGDTLASSERTEGNVDEETLLNVTKTSAESGSLPKKARKVRSVKEKTLVCDVCKRGFISKLNYEKHILTHREDKCKNVFNCDLCDKGFLKKHNANRHFKKVHMPGIFACGECPKYFRSRSGLRDHKKTCHGPRDELLTCPTCGKIFTLKKSLVHHLRKFPTHGMGTSEYNNMCGAIDA